MSKVLIIDDDAMARRMAEFSLKKLGLTAVSAGSGAEGLVRMREDSPDLTLLDVEMPEMDGISVLKAVRLDAQLQDAPVCLMTGTVTDSLRAEADTLHACGLLQKPLAPPALKAMLEEIGML